MTPQEAVLRVRSIYDENGVTSGFLDNTLDIYKYIDSAHSEIIQILILQLRALRKAGVQGGASKSLTPLIKLQSQNTTAALAEYAKAADYLETYNVEYSPDTAGIYYTCSYLDYSEVKQRQKFTLLQGNTGPGAEATYYYLRETYIGVDPVPSASLTGGIIHSYIYKPPEITSSVTVFILGVETHEAIVKYAAAMAFIRDGEPVLAEGLLKQFYELASQL